MTGLQEGGDDGHERSARHFGYGLRGGTGVWSQASPLGDEAHCPVKQEKTFRHV